MTEKSRFFNSTPEDERRYQAEEFAEYFNQFLSNGLFHQDLVPELEVKSEGTDMQVYVEPGSAWIEGYMYINDANLYLEHDTAEATDDRIDRVVLRLDLATEYRNIRAYVLKGTPASPGNAEPPALTRDDWQYELSLAQVLIPADTGTIDPNNITDEREDEEVCGLVTSLISPDIDAPTQAEFDDHSARHESAGADEISIAGLQGESAELATHKSDNTPHREIASMERKNKDAEGIFTLIEFKRENGTMFKTSELSGGTSPQYTTRTVIFYEEDGTTIKEEFTLDLTYDEDDDLVSEVIAV